MKNGRAKKTSLLSNLSHSMERFYKFPKEEIIPYIANLASRVEKLEALFKKPKTPEETTSTQKVPLNYAAAVMHNNKNPIPLKAEVAAKRIY